MHLSRYFLEKSQIFAASSKRIPPYISIEQQLELTKSKQYEKKSY